MEKEGGGLKVIKAPDIRLWSTIFILFYTKIASKKTRAQQEKRPRYLYFNINSQCTTLYFLICLSKPYLLPKWCAFYIQILPTCIDNGNFSLGIRLDLIRGICCMGDSPSWIQSNGGSIPFEVTCLSVIFLHLQFLKRDPDGMFNLFIEKIDYYFSPTFYRSQRCQVYLLSRPSVAQWML